VSLAVDGAAGAQLNQLLDEALELAPEQRLSWLEALDVWPAPLKDQLRSLLAGGALAENFLSTLPPIGNAEQTGAQHQVVGRYRLIRELGTGGMGAVWLAERTDGLLNRPVALKLPHRAWGSALLSERMAREREILAALNHSNIATLYDAGVADDGQPFLALEYVAGEPIDVYCETRRLPLRARLKLFLQVADAVAHAHTKLIVHRDLKPSNILVTAAGQVRLLDFGIAKLLEEAAPTGTSLTELSGQALTPEYAAPEQIIGAPITVAADVYSLGVVLYELLTSTRPYELKRDSRGALEDAILEAQPRKPSDVAPTNRRKSLRGDLDLIVLQALKKEPHERYATVHAFVEDIQRHLRHRPVLARPDHWRYIVGKFIARNKLAVIAASLVVLTSVTGAGVASWEARTAHVETQRAEDARKLLATVLQDANPYAARVQPHTVDELLVRASNDIQQRKDLSPALRVEVLTVLGTGLLNSQNTAAAERVLSHAVDEAQQRLGLEHPLTTHARVALLPVHRFRGRTALLRSQLDDLLPRLRTRTSTYPEDLIVALKNKAHVELEDGHYAAAEAAAREERDTALRSLGPEHPESVTALMMLALAVQHSRDPAYALTISEQAYRRTVQYYHNDPSHPRVIEAERLYGFALAGAGRTPEALAHIRTAVNQALAVFGSNCRMSGLYRVDLARVELQHGEFEQALADSRAALENVGAHADKNSFRYADALSVRADALLATGHAQDAQQDLRVVVDILKRTVGATHALTIAASGKLDLLQQRTAARTPLQGLVGRH
jgi:serine/threonine-protein kinase